MDAAAWGRVLAGFEAEAADPPSQDRLEAWEVCLLARAAARELGLQAKERKRLQGALLRSCQGAALAECKVSLLERFPAPSPAAAAPGAGGAPAPEAAGGRAERSRSRSARRGRGPGDAGGPRGHMAAPACLGPPAFFPVGNAAGRHAPLSRGLATPAPRLLLVGLSDPRHLLAALRELPADARPSFVANDLNAESCARSALILALLGSDAPEATRLVAVFSLWWMHELPRDALPLLADEADACASGARAPAVSCCAATRDMLRAWAARWRGVGEAAPPRDLREVLALCALPEALREAAQRLLSGGCVDNCTLQHRAGQLDYGMYRERAPPEGWVRAGDGVLLWPEPPPEEEFETDQGQPPRAEYCRAAARRMPAFSEAISFVSHRWLRPGLARCEFLAGDCLLLPGRVAGGFHRAFTSNVADHVGVPALALTVGQLLEEGGLLAVSLSNNLRALGSSGDARALLEKVHGAPPEAVVAACGMRIAAAALPPGADGQAQAEAEKDQLCLAAGASDGGAEAAAEALREWPVECASRLYRCPRPDPDTVARRSAQGEVLGMAHRYARRFTVSPVTVACIAALVGRAARALPAPEAAELAARVKRSLAHSRLRLSQCLDWPRLPAAVVDALAPEVRPPPAPRRLASIGLPPSSVPRWAWRAHPQVVLVWCSAVALESARASGISLEVSEPVWARCRVAEDVRFLEDGAWGPLAWALRADPGEVQIFDAPELQPLPGGGLRVSVELPFEELGRAGGDWAAFLLSTVDNAVVTGPHRAEEFER